MSAFTYISSGIMCEYIQFMWSTCLSMAVPHIHILMVNSHTCIYNILESKEVLYIYMYMNGG